jgi:hypothetical protein
MHEFLSLKLTALGKMPVAQICLFFEFCVSPNKYECVLKHLFLKNVCKTTTYPIKFIFTKS